MNILPRLGYHALYSAVFLLAFGLSLFSPQILADYTDGPSNLIWTGLSQSVIGVDTEVNGSVVNIALEHDPEALAVDERRQAVWVYQSDELSSYNFDGALLLKQELKLPQGRATGLWVDTDDGSLWLLANKRLLKLDAMGLKRFEINLSERPIGTFDSNQKLFWVGQGKSLIAFSQEGIKAKALSLDGHIHALSYDALEQKLKFVADASLYEFNGTDNPELLLSDQSISQANHLASGRDGVIWLADDRNVVRISADSNMTSYRPLEKHTPEIIVDIESIETGGLWIAGWRELVRLDSLGQVIGTVSPEFEDSRKHNMILLAEHSRITGAELTVVTPDDGTYLNTAFPSFFMRLEDSEIDASTVKVTVDDKALSTTCEAQGDMTQCDSTMPLADGDHVVTIVASDLDGRQSLPAKLLLRIDTRPPQIVVESPPSGLITNTALQPVTGSIDEFATVSVAGDSVDVDQNYHFAFSSYKLVEGENEISIEAIDRAGNSEQETVIVILDTLPPTKPDSSLIEVSLSADGIAQVDGFSNSVEPGSTVTIVNVQSGERILVQADDSGQFHAQISALDGNFLAISVADGAGNVSDVTELNVEAVPGLEPLQLNFVSPRENDVVSGDHVLVTLRLEGPENSGVVVNGTVATLFSNADGSVTAYAWVPVSQGSNTLTATASDMDNREISTSLTLQNQKASIYSVLPSVLTGLGPLNVNFKIHDKHRAGINEIGIDFDGDGVSDQAYSGEQTSITHTYAAGSGLNITTFLITDRYGLVHEEVVPIMVLDQEFLDSQVRLVWSNMLAALNEGDVDGALKCMISGSRENYGSIFQALLPYMPGITAGFSDIYQLSLYSDMASYVLMTVKDGEARVFVAQFMVDNNGIWRVDSF